MLETLECEISNRTRKFVDKAEQKKYKIQLEKQVISFVNLLFQLENLYTLIQTRVPTMPDGDNAILSKKPLGGWSCGSCEKNLTNIQVNQS